MKAQKKDRKELEILFKQYCCAHICQDVLAEMKNDWIQHLIAHSLHRSLVIYKQWGKRRAMIKIASETGLALSTVEKKFYKKAEDISLICIA